MNQPFKRALGAMGLALAVALSACGGGGDSPASATSTANLASNGTADPYVGSYQSACQQDDSTSSYRVNVTVAKKSVNTADVTYKFVAYAGISCAGTGTPLSAFDTTETWTIVGTKTASGKTVDKITTPIANGTEKDIAYTDGSRVIFGDFSGPLDNEGYPLNLDTSDDDALTRI